MTEFKLHPTTADRIAKIEAKLEKNPDASLLKEDDFAFYRDFLLARWEAAKATLEKAKADEMDWRKAVVKFAFDPNKKSGTEHIELDNGYEAKAVKKQNYGFIKNLETNRTDKAKIDAALTAIELRSPAGSIIAERLVKWTPDLSLTEYKQLPAEDKEIIDSVLIVTDGAPTLEIVAPKGSK